MPAQSNTRRVALVCQNEISRLVFDFENKVVEAVEAVANAKKKQILVDVLSRAKEIGVISHPSQEYKEAVEESIDKMLQQNKEQIEEFSKKIKEFFEILENDKEAAYSFYEKEFQNLGFNIPIPEEKDGVCADLQLIKQFVGKYC